MVFDNGCFQETMKVTAWTKRVHMVFVPESLLIQLVDRPSLKIVTRAEANFAGFQDGYA